MPRVEVKTRMGSGGIWNCGPDWKKIPEGAEMKVIVEWDDPPKNDWTPKDVAMRECSEWKSNSLDKRSVETVMIDVANKVSEFERAKCADVVMAEMGDWDADTMEFRVLEKVKDKILARINENAGYPRLEE